MKNLHFGLLASRIIETQLLINDIESTLKLFASNGVISGKLLQSVLNSFSDLLYMRNRTQELTQSENCVIDESVIASLSEKIGIPIVDINKLLNQSQTKILSTYIEIKKCALYSVRKNQDIGDSDHELILDVISKKKKSSNALIEKAMASNNELLSILLSYIIDSPKLLEELRKRNLTNWYVLYGIANNKNSSEDTLLHLMLPRKDENHEIGDLYTSFSWRNIYLYIAKNPSATQKVLEYISTYKNARPMDIKATLRNTL